MRRRLLLSSLAVSLATVLLLCIPLGFIAASLIRDDYNHRLDRNLQNITASIVELSSEGRHLTTAELTELVPPDRRAIYTPRHGPAISAGHVSGHLDTATTTIAPGTAHSATVQMQVPHRILTQRLWDIWLVIAGLGLVVTLIGVLLSRWVANRLSRPLRALARAAERFGNGDLRPSSQRYKIGELDQLATVLDASAVKLAATIENERRFSIDTSHQLRTPLTSLTVRLEEIRSAATDPTIRHEAEAALQQVERLIDVVTDALTGRTSTAPPPAIGLAALLDSQRVEWEPAYRRQHRTLAVELSPTPPVLATEGGLKQAVSTLLENALIHGAGTTHVRTRVLPGHVVIEVSDEGNGVPNSLADRIFSRHVTGGCGTGLGLPLAQTIIEADGGRLQLTSRKPAQFSIFLARGDITPQSTPDPLDTSAAMYLDAD